MALTDEVIARYSNQDLVNLTNPKSTSATTVDTTRLANAATDVGAYFKIYANITYDNTVATHVALGIEGVVLLLEKYQVNSRVSLDDWFGRLRDLAKIGARNRIVPTTDSVRVREADEDGKFPLDINKDFETITPNKGI